MSTRTPITPAVATPAPLLPSAKEGGITLPKIEVTKFDGIIMNW